MANPTAGHLLRYVHSVLEVWKWPTYSRSLRSPWLDVLTWQARDWSTGSTYLGEACPASLDLTGPLDDLSPRREPVA